MTHQIVKVDNYLFAIGDNYKHDVFPYLVIEKQTNGGYVVWQVDNLNDWDEKNQYQILAHLPLHNAPFLEGVPLLPPFEQEDDVENMGEDATNLRILKHKTPSQVARQYFDGYVEGYNKAREKYKYTEEDVIYLLHKTARKYFQEGRDYKGNMAIAGDPLHGIRRELINTVQSLSKYPIGFECEIEPKYVHIGAEKGVKGSGNRIKNKNGGKPKTFINRDGRTEWVGKWVY